MNLNGKIKKTQALTGRLVKSSGGGGSVQEIYWVRYGVGAATNAEVNEAVAANKLPICYFDSTNGAGQTTRTIYVLIHHTPTEALFATVLPTTETIEVKRLYADAWRTQIIRYEGKLTWDQTPRFGSVNPVTSGGIYNAIQNATVSDERIAEAVDDWLTAQAPSIGTLSYAAKQALLACFRKVAWIDDQGQSYYNALESELFPDATLESITAVFTQGSAIIYESDTLDTLRQYLVVTATYSDSTTATVTDYTLSGTLTEGTSTITVSYGGKTDTFDVTVTATTLYALYDYIKYTGTDYSGSTTANNIMISTPVYDNLNALIIDYDWSPTHTTTAAAGILGGHHTSGSGNNYYVSFYGDTSRQRVSVFSHGTALGINEIPNVVVGGVCHVNLNPGSQSPSTLSADSLSTTGAWAATQTVNGRLGYFGQHDSGGSTLKNFAAIGVVKLYSLANDLLAEYHPCVRTTDNVIGIYDSVGDAFYTAPTTSYATVGNTNCKYTVGSWEDLS